MRCRNEVSGLMECIYDWLLSKACCSILYSGKVHALVIKEAA
jgi:hypothetical protein